MASNLYSIIVLIVLGLLLVRAFRNQEEGFQTLPSTLKSLQIHACPTFASEIQTSKGNTDCCEGSLLDGKCSGKTFCTKSPTHDGIPTCVDAWREYFQKKGTDFCPSSMPNYYEDVLNPKGAKGCSAGPIGPNGKEPTDRAKARCQIYPTEVENRTKLDSCYLEKERSKIQCPVVNGSSPPATMISDPNTKVFQMFACQYPFELNMPTTCYEKRSFYKYLDTKEPNWRTKSGGMEDAKRQICDTFIVRRNTAFSDNLRLEAERKAKEAAQKEVRSLGSLVSRFASFFRRNLLQKSRLQQQLDEANRRAMQR